MRTEPFEDYAKINRGIPFLHLRKRGNSASVYWSDGVLLDYDLFRHSVESDEMNLRLRCLFWNRVPKTRRKAELHTGSVIGGMYGVPPDIAETAFTIVRDYFNKGLNVITAAQKARP